MDWAEVFGFSIGAPEKIVRTIAVYLGIVILVRVAGKRLMAQMNSLDLVVVLLLSNVVQNAIIGDDLSVGGAVLGATVLIAANAGLDHLASTFKAVRSLVIGHDTQLIHDGELDEETLARLGVTEAELHNRLRTQGAGSVAEVRHGLLAPGGNVVIDLFDDAQPVSRADLDRAMADMKSFVLTHLRSQK